MAPVVPDPRTIRAFKTEAAFEKWLQQNHDRATEVYVRMYKKGSSVPSINHTQAVEVALCWGWIDGLRKSYDEQSFLQRFSPRKPKSVWSQINRQHVARLIAAGRMTPHGLKHVQAAQADGRWDAAYAGPATSEVPADLRAAIEAEPKALTTFETLNKQNLFALTFRTNGMKTAAGRAKKIAAFVAMLKRGEDDLPEPEAKARAGRENRPTRAVQSVIGFTTAGALARPWGVRSKRTATIQSSEFGSNATRRRSRAC